MVVVFKIDKEKARLPLESIGEILQGFKDAVNVITDEEKMLVICFSPVTSEAVSKAFGVTINDVEKIREFEVKGKGRYLIYEGVNRKGRYEKIEVIFE